MQIKKVHVAVVDHRDSFTFTLVDYCEQLGAKVTVFSVDALPSCDDLKRLCVTHLLFSPGPGHPSEYKASLVLMEKSKARWPILGVCLGHQLLAYLDGATVKSASMIMHGRSSNVLHQKTGLLAQVPTPFSVMRYHSLVVDPKTLSDEWCIDAYSEDGTLMAMHHRRLALFGLQYHPESVLTDQGLVVLKCFLER